MAFPNFCVLSLTLLVAASAMGMTFDNYLNISRSMEHLLIGAGLTSTTVVAREQILAYSSLKKKGLGNSIQYYQMTTSQMECRLYGYLRACSHPFVEFGGNLNNTDVLSPFTLDFLLANDYVKASTFKPVDVKQYPLYVTGMVPIFNVPGIKRLVLTPITLAKMFRGCLETNPACLPGSITMWNDTAIKETNPSSVHPFLDAAGAIRIIIRREAAPATEVVRRALSKFDSDFNHQVGIGNNNNWTAVNVFQTVTTAEGLIETVSDNPSTIGYVPANLLDDAEVGLVDLTPGDGIVLKANAGGIAAAVEDFGLAFGNDGRNPSENTVDLTNSKASRSWPISTYTYVVLRTNRTDEACFNKSTLLLKFLENFYTPANPDHDRGALSQGLAPIPKAYAAQILDKIRRELRCNGTLVYDFGSPAAQIVVYSEATSRGPMKILARAFEDIVGTDQVQIEVRPLVAHQELETKLKENETGHVVLADENLTKTLLNQDATETNGALLSFPYAITSGMFVYNFCDFNDPSCTANSRFESLIFDIGTAVAIIKGEIRFWNDSRIAALNPTLTLPSIPIAVFSPPLNSEFSFKFVQQIREEYDVDFVFAVGDANLRPTYAEVYKAVAVHVGSFAYVPQNGTIANRVINARLMSRSGHVVPNSVETLEACASDTYKKGINSFTLSASKQTNCYPLIDSVMLITRKRYTSVSETSSRVAKMTARFMQYIIQQSIRKGDDGTALTSSSLGTLSDFAQGDNDVAETNNHMLQSITLDDVSILIVPHNMRLIPAALIILLYVVMSILILLYIALGVWVFVHRNRKLIRNSSPTFMLQVLLGATLMALTVIPLAQQDDFRSSYGVSLDDLNPPQPALNAACVSQPFMFSFGFFIIFSALFLKSWRLIRIFNNKKLRNLFLQDRQLLIYQAMVMLVVLILNIIWALQSPLVWGRSAIFVDSKLELVVDSVGLCFSPAGIYPALPLAIGIALSIGFGNYLAYLGRRIPTEFNESKWTALSMVVALEAIVLGVPVLALANDQPVAGFLVKASLCLLISGATVCLIFIPKVAMAYGWGVVEGDSNPWRFVKAGSSGSNNANGKSDHPDNVNGTAHQSTNNSKKNGIISPSLNSLVSGRVFVATTDSPSPSPTSRIMGKHLSKEFPIGSSISQLKQILDSDPTRRRFRRYLQTLKMDENIRFWDCVTILRAEPTLEKRVTSTRAVIQTFVSDSAPFQVNLSSQTRSEILMAFQTNDKARLGSDDFFNKAMDELFHDLRQSDAFRTFLEHDTFSNADLSKSDPTVLVTSHGPL